MALHATIRTELDHARGDVNPRLFGSFVEHLGRCVYSGIYEPGHPSADEHGFRRDVLDLVRELGVTTVRYPGGNFVSGYRWEDGIGPQDERPRRLDLAWHSTETNEFGLDEFMEWTRAAGIEPMMAVNLGTRGLEEALDLLEYTNVPAGTALADRRAANGHEAPYGVTMWCLGNEMDGPWQLGHRDAAEYGELAARTGAGMLQIDPSLELVVCGSSNSSMPTFGSWEREVLRRTWGTVSHISCHAYYEEKNGDRQSFLASAVDMDRFIATVAGAIDEVAAEMGEAGADGAEVADGAVADGADGESRPVSISFDEWNVWYQRHWENEEKVTGATDPWPVAPRLLENSYTVTDAVVVGSLLISLIRRADVVTSASLAQLVNAIAPIMTEPGGPAWRQTIFYPFAVAAGLARGEVVECRVSSDTVPTSDYGDVPAVDAIATVDRTGGRGLLMAVNRSLGSESVVDLGLALAAAGSADGAETPGAAGMNSAPGEGGVRITRVRVLSDPELDAANTLEDPDRVTLRDVSLEDVRGGSITLPPVSWVAIEFEL